MEHIEVSDFIEHEDGSASITVSMDYEIILFFAKKGLLATLIEAANEAKEDESQDQ
jgi:hypothetical protein